MKRSACGRYAQGGIVDKKASVPGYVDGGAVPQKPHWPPRAEDRPPEPGVERVVVTGRRDDDYKQWDRSGDYYDNLPKGPVREYVRRIQSQIPTKRMADGGKVEGQVPGVDGRKVKNDRPATIYRDGEGVRARNGGKVK
jgi:hypothetical protein